MIWRSSFHSRIVQFADFLTVQLGFILAYLIWDLLSSLGANILPNPFSLEIQHLFQISLLGIVYVILFRENMAYSYQRFTSLFREYLIVIKVSVLGLFLMVFTTVMFGDKALPRTIFILSFISILSLLIVQKTILFFIAKKMRNKGFNRKRVLVIGTGSRAKQFVEIVEKNFGWGLDIIGLISGDDTKVGKNILGHNVIGSYDDIDTLIKQYNPEEIMITISTKRFDEIRKVLESCELVGMNVRLNSDFFGYLAKNVQIDNLFGLNIISFYFTHRSELALFVKRIMDIVISAITLIIISPLLLIISFLIYVQDGNPILYKWNVVGKNRKSITSWKFRTMVKNADEMKENLLVKNEMTGPMFKMTNDPRILRIGHLLRKYSLDELPQLWSVFIGDLSLVGPRPPLQTEFREFDLWHRRKLSVKPGITCLWQISGRNHIKSFDDWARLDLQYIDNWSLLLDIKILLKTIPAVFTGRGAK